MGPTKVFPNTDGNGLIYQFTAAAVVLIMAISTSFYSLLPKIQDNLGKCLIHKDQDGVAYTITT